MAVQIETVPQTASERVDSLIFIKNGYSFYAHLVPVGIASLLLLLLTVPADNLLLKLVEKLQKPGPVWLPAIFLTIISAFVYLSTVHAKIQQTYLWPEGDWRRTIGTFIFYTLLVCLLIFFVLLSVRLRLPSIGDLWAVLLVAFLSLTGLGWQGPTSWAEAIGIKLPSYTEGREAAKNITKFLAAQRKKTRSEAADIHRFLELIKALRSEIEKNLVYEPDWARPKLQSTSNLLQKMIDHVEEDYKVDDPSMIEGFASACKCSKQRPYQEFVEILALLSQDWPAWGCAPQKGL